MRICSYDDYTKTSLMLLRIALILYIHPPYLNPNFELRSSNGNLQYFKIVRIVSSVPILNPLNLLILLCICSGNSQSVRPFLQ